MNAVFHILLCKGRAMKHAKPKRKPSRKRAGAPSKQEREMAKALVKDTPHTVTLDQTKALAKLFNRPVSTVKSMLTKARESLAADAQTYVDTHRQVVEHAALIGIATENPKALDVARKGAAWAIANISGEGKRLVEKQESGPQGLRVMVGVKLSGVSGQPETVIAINEDAAEGEILE